MVLATCGLNEPPAVAGSAPITSELKHQSTRSAGLSLGSAHLHSDGFAFCQGLPSSPPAFWGFISRHTHLPPPLSPTASPARARTCLWDFFFTRAVSNWGRGCLPISHCSLNPVWARHTGQSSWCSLWAAQQPYRHVAPRAFQVELIYAYRTKAAHGVCLDTHVQCCMWSQLLHNHVFTKRG